MGAEESEQRPQLVLGPQAVQRAAAGRGQDRRLAGERVLVQQVEDMLQRAGVGSAIDRRADDHQVRHFDAAQQDLARPRQRIARRRRQQHRADHGQVDQAGGCVDAALHRLEHGLDQDPRARRAGEVSGQSDDRS